MRLDRNEIIAGHRIKLVRDFLRTYRNGRPDLHSIGEFFGTEGDSTMVVAALVERGLIAIATPEQWDQRPVAYTVTELGIRVAAASLLKPIPRAKAETIVRELLARVEQVNARDDLTHFVGDVRAFGSYVTESSDLADIDLAISFIAKPPPNGMRLTDWHLQRARVSGCTFSNYLEELTYSQNEVRRLVKGRNQYVSIHEIGELDELKIESRSLYASPDRPCHVFPASSG